MCQVACQLLVQSEVAVSGDPAWVVPAITASASLVGTVVGGLATYVTSKRSHERATVAERTMQRNTLLRQSAMRFVAAIADMSRPASGSERITQQWGPVADELLAARSEEELVRAAKAIDPSIEAGEGRVAILIRLIRQTGIYEEEMQKRFTLLSELRFIAPGDVADSAQRVLYRAFAQEMIGVIAPHRQAHATDAFNREINDFVNRVRRHMNVEHIDFEFIHIDALHDAFEIAD